MALVAGLAAPAAGIVYLMQTDEDMVRQSPLIFYGQVIGTAPARLDGRPATDARVRVEKVLKGRQPGSVVTVRQPGGVDGETVFQMMGLPMLSPGDRVLLFLKEHEEVHRTVGLGLGIFFEASHVGRTILVREAPHMASGRVAEESAVRDGARFLRWIADRAAGRESRADYLVADVPGKPEVVRSPYTLNPSDDGCYLPDDSPAGETLVSIPPRWERFDTGGTLTFSAFGIQPGLSADGADDATKVADAMAGVRAAMSAWNAAAPSVSLAATWLDPDPLTLNGPVPTKYDILDLEAAILFDCGVHYRYDDPRCPSNDGVLAQAWLLGVCPNEPPDYRPGTIPGTNVFALPADRTMIYLDPNLGERSAEMSVTDARDLFHSVVLHEIGHSLGLGHTDVPGSIMFLPLGSTGALGPDDVAGINFLYPGGSAAPAPSPSPEPQPPESDCTLVAPHWSGPTGGFTVRPEAGRTSVSLTCGGRTTEYSAEDGLVTRLVESSCRGDGLQLTGAAPGGWYWQHGDRNAAVAPLVCSEALGGTPAAVPGGVTAEATDQGTLIRHDTARLIGIVPHLAGNDCDEYVTPYWQGDGGVVVRPAEGRETVRVRVQCGRTSSTMTPSAGEDGVIAELVEKSYCTDDEGTPKQGRLTVTGAAPGGWYWIRGEANAAVAPLMCADLLGGPGAVDPGGVLSRATEDGTYFEHDVNSLIGVVPHLGPNAEDE